MPVFSRAFSREVGGDLIDIHRNALNTNDSYLGAAFPGNWASFRTDTAVASSSQNAVQHILDIYSSGHWGSQPVCIIDIHGTYYRPTWWRVMMQLDFNMLKMYRWGPVLSGSNNPYIEVQNSGNTSSTLAVTHNSTSWGTSNNGLISWTPGSTYTEVVGSGTHSGQSVYRQRLRLVTGAVYMQCYAVIHLLNGGSPRTYFANTSTSTASAFYVTNGSGFHLPGIDKPNKNTTAQFK